MLNISNKLYNALKWVTMVFLPALATLYISLADVWSLPFGEEVGSTIMAVVVFLGIFLQINSAQYKVFMATNKNESVKTMIRPRFVLSNSVYDKLKWTATVFLPAISALYVALADVWNLPYSMEIAGTISAMVFFLGALLQISSLQYRTSLIVAAGGDYEDNPEPDVNIISFTNETYDLLKFIAQGVLPGLATLYVALASIWGFPYAEEISATIMAVVLFMNALLQISSLQYNAAIRARRR